MEYVQKILEWPIIVQGALGSLLFYAAFELTKFLTKKSSSFYEKFNKQVRRETLLFEKAQASANISSRSEASQMLVFCIYGSVNKACKGLVFVGFGLIVYNFVPVFSTIAFAIAIYYFFRALRIVNMGIEDKTQDEHKEELERIEKELTKLN
jgi:hypothetical protein